jgi:hypothetical protein
MAHVAVIVRDGIRWEYHVPADVLGVAGAILEEAVASSANPILDEVDGRREAEVRRQLTEFGKWLDQIGQQATT